MTRKCQEWELNPFTNKQKCVKLTIVAKMVRKSGSSARMVEEIEVV